MNDQVLMDNYLYLLKSTIEVYVHGTLESSNEKVRETLKSALNDTLSMQATTYDLMTTHGWYNVSNVKSNEISKVLKKVNNS